MPGITYRYAATETYWEAFYALSDSQKESACGLCKPHKRGWAGKRRTADLRLAIGHEHQLRDAAI